MNSRRLAGLRLLATLAIGGAVFQGCGIINFVSNINPCGTVLNCDPSTYRFATSGYRGPGINPNIDPSCSYPPFCSPPYAATIDPFVVTPP